MTELALPPAAIREKGIWQFGRYRQPFAQPDFQVHGLQKFRLKQWHYLSFNAPEWFLALAIVDLGYLGNLFAYFVPKRNPADFQEIAQLSPLANAIMFAPSSIAGTTTWSSSLGTIAIEGSPTSWACKLDLKIKEKNLQGELLMNTQNQESIATLFDFGNARPGYTHKLCAAPTQATLKWGGESLPSSDILGSSDWTRGFCLHETVWKWASLAGRSSQGVRLGLNLSAQIYDNPVGESIENAYWVDGNVHALGRVDFHLPANPTQEVWTIRCPTSNPEVDLKFQPLGARQQNTGFGPIKSAFVQPFGTFSGKLGEHRIENIFGVVEDHYARW